MKFYGIILIVFLFSVLSTFSLTANASIEVLGSLKHVIKGKPGDVIKGEIKIQNNDNTDQEVKVYQTDLSYNYQNNTFYDAPVSFIHSNAQWIQFSPKSIILKPKEVRAIQYEMVIPKDDSLKGTFWSVLMVEGVVAFDPAQKGDLKINTTTRYAIQLISEMTNKGKGSLKFMEPTLSREGKKLFLAADLLNNGDHYIAPDVSIEFFDDNGASIRVINATGKGLFPTTSARYRFDLNGIPGRKSYKTIITATGLADEVFTLEYTLNL